MPDVVIVGPLANTDIAVAEALIRHGLDCVAVRKPPDDIPDLSALPGPRRWLARDKIITYRDPLHLYRLCRSAKCVITLTGCLPSYLHVLWLLLPLLPFPPIVNITTGSDITELARSRSRSGFIYRQLLRRAAFNWVATTPEALESLRRLHITNVEFLRFPMFPSKRISAAPASGPIVYFHPSKFDWGESDRKPGRNSTKGTDRFFRAFFRAAAQGANIRCIVLDRGADRLIARKAIEESGFADLFEWRPAVTQSEMPALCAQADVVVDQFDAGFFGWTAWEAMAQGKPVLIHLDHLCLDLVYDEKPPVLAAKSEEDIYRTITSYTDRAALQALGNKAEAWARRNHYSDIDVPRLIFRMATAAGINWSAHMQPQGGAAA